MLKLKLGLWLAIYGRLQFSSGAAKLQRQGGHRIISTNFPAILFVFFLGHSQREASLGHPEAGRRLLDFDRNLDSVLIRFHFNRRSHNNFEVMKNFATPTE